MSCRPRARSFWREGRRCACAYSGKIARGQIALRVPRFFSGLISKSAKRRTADEIASTVCSAKKTPDTAIFDGFSGAAAAKSDDRTSAGHRFDRHHPEILLTRKDQGLASRVVPFQDIERLRAHDRHGGAGKASNFIEHLAAADHYELQFHFIEGTDGQIRPLVGDEFSGHQIIVTDLGG